MRAKFTILTVITMAGGVVWAAGQSRPPTVPEAAPAADPAAAADLPRVTEEEDPGAVPKGLSVAVETGEKTVQVGSLRWRTGRKLLVPAAETWKGDLYALTGKSIIEGVLQGDATLFTTELNVTGTVTQDLNAAAGEVRLSGAVNDDLHVATSKLIVSGTVGSDLLAWSGQTELAREGVVHGSAVIYSGQVDLQGKVEGAAKITGGKVEINGEIGGDVIVSCDELIVGPQARIAGHLTYDARNTIDVPAGMVAGGVTKTEHPPGANQPAAAEGESPFRFSAGFVFFWNLFLAVVALIAGVLLLLFFKPFVDSSLQRSRTGQGVGACFGIGLVGFLVLLVAGVLCLCLLPLALGLWSALGALVYFGGLIGKMILGNWILILLRRRAAPGPPAAGNELPVPALAPPAAGHPLLSLVIGIALVFLFRLIPFVGWLIWFLVTVTGIGAALLQLRGGRQGEVLSVTLPA